MTRFDGAGELADAEELGYEQTLEALLGLIGRPVLVLFSGTHGSPTPVCLQPSSNAGASARPTNPTAKRLKNERVIS